MSFEQRSSKQLSTSSNLGDTRYVLHSGPQITYIQGSTFRAIFKLVYSHDSVAPLPHNFTKKSKILLYLRLDLLATTDSRTLPLK